MSYKKKGSEKEGKLTKKDKKVLKFVKKYSEQIDTAVESIINKIPTSVPKNNISNCEIVGVKWDGKAIESVNVVAKALLNLTELFKSQNIKIDTMIKLEGLNGDSNISKCKFDNTGDTFNTGLQMSNCGGVVGSGQ